MTLRIDKKLNLIVPVERDSGRLYVHAAPLSRDVFERYTMVIAKTFSRIYSEGLGAIAGPRVAANILKMVATELDEWEGPEGVQNGLMNEIVRLSNAVVPAQNGWQTIPLHDAVSKGLIDQDDLSEILNALVFFTLVSSMHRRNQVPEILKAIGPLWDTQTTSLNSTEFAGSLTTLIDSGNTTNP